ncbi:small ribosomal subunit protein uS4c-like [Cryptomeria japonica]|uniref:small ribosomal subunit protein uS4c-like n=1 Tax=Cryptomeria japonica TaxID=3369 RepID=UPI0027DA0896|nr:small ribosomal subunit protein uS4c-like [Cryptomeria japonica]
MALTIPEARQLVNHRHILVNDRIVDIPSYRCKPQDFISIKDKQRLRDKDKGKGKVGGERIEIDAPQQDIPKQVAPVQDMPDVVISEHDVLGHDNIDSLRAQIDQLRAQI